MRLFLSLPVLAVALALVLEGPVPCASSEPDVPRTLETLPNRLKEFGNKVEDKLRSIIEDIKQREITIKAREWLLETFRNLKEKFTTPSNTMEGLHV